MKEPDVDVLAFELLPQRVWMRSILYVTRRPSLVYD
jgi:hypothetical protein